MKSTIEFFKDICDIYQQNENIKIKKEKIILDLPENFKTATKIEFMKSLPNELSKQDFIELLMNQTHGGDHVNFDALVNIAKLKIDSNNNIIFNSEITYRNCKKEAYYIWLVLSIIKNHPFFSKYNIFEFTLQEKLELLAVPAKNNFKFDLCFNNIPVAIEINENHHFKKKQIILDNEKVALSIIYGKLLIPIVTDRFDNMRNIKKSICKTLIKLVQDNKINFIKTIYEMLPLLDIDEELIVDKIIYQIYIKFRKKLTMEQIDKDNKFISQIDIDLAEKIVDKIIDLVENYVETNIDIKIHKYILYSKSNKNFASELLDEILNASINNYDIRLDYIKTFFTESLFDMFDKSIEFVSQITKDKYSSNKMYIESITESLKESNDLKQITDSFIIDSSTFDRLFELKRKSLLDKKNPNVITYDNILHLYGINDDAEFKNFISYTCKISIDTEILISWQMLNTILMKWCDNIGIRNIMLLYYRELDSLYEIITERNIYINTKLRGTNNTYDTYINRLNKFNAEYKEEHRVSKIIINKLCADIDFLKINKIYIEPNSTVDVVNKSTVEPIIIKKNYTQYDIECLSRTNIQERFKILSDELNNINQNINI